MPDIERLYREHRAGLVRLVERELRDRQDAEDVVQTAFLDAQHALERGTIPQNPRAWLSAIALNAARRLRRRGGPVNVGPLEEYAVEEALRLPEIKAALAGLPKKEQAAVLYRDLVGLSYAETAAQMGTTVPAVTMLLHRARSRLRGRLGIALVGAGRWRWLRGDGSEAAAASRVAGVAVLAGGLASAGVGGVATVGPAVRAVRPAIASWTRPATQRTHALSGAMSRRGGTVGGADRDESGSRARATAAPAVQPAAPAPAPSSEAVPVKAAEPVARVSTAPLPAPTPPGLQVRAPTLPLPTPATPAPTVTTPPTAAPPVAAVLPPTAATVSTPIAAVTVTVP